MDEVTRRSFEIERLITLLKSNLRRCPKAGAVIGMVNIGDLVDHQVGTVDFGPIHYIALVDGALERAAERMAAMLDPPRDLIARCEKARAILDFDDSQVRN